MKRASLRCDCECVVGRDVFSITEEEFPCWKVNAFPSMRMLSVTFAFRGIVGTDQFESAYVPPRGS